MKKLLKSALVVLVCFCMLMSVSACGKKEDEKPQTTVDLSAYPATFADWKMGDMKKYLEEADITTNEDFILMDLSENEIAAIGCETAFLYVDGNGGTVMDIVMKFDGSTEEGKKMIAGISENKAIVVNGDVENSQPMDALLGDYCFSYGLGLDEEHIAKIVKVLKELQSYYNIEGGYILD